MLSLIVAYPSIGRDTAGPASNQRERYTTNTYAAIISIPDVADQSVRIVAGADLNEEAVPTRVAPDSFERSADAVLNMLKERLSLGADQMTKILPILMERRQKIRDALADRTLSRRQKVTQITSMLDQSDKRINPLLSPEQQKAYAVVEQGVKAKLNARHSRAAARTD